MIFLSYFTTMELPMELLAAVLVVLLTIVLVYFIFGRSGVRRPNILIAGLCDSGKTLLFTQLTHDVYKLTHTSLQENRGTIEIKDSEVTIIDIPGHERQRQRMVEKYTPTARAVMFIVDSSTVIKDIKDVAEYLYILLTDADIAKGRVPILIACNKQDLSFTKSSTVIQSLLEKELTTVRRTQSAVLEGTDGISVNRRQLGSEDADFEFRQLLPQKVSVVECSARGPSASGDSPELDSVRRWVSAI